jgi:hypothetical protein
MIGPIRILAFAAALGAPALGCSYRRAGGRQTPVARATAGAGAIYLTK